MRFALVILLLGAGCASSPEQDLPSGKDLKDPKKLLPTFQAFVQAGVYAKAHKCFSRDAQRAVPYEPFYAILTAYETTARLIAGLEEHGIDKAAGTIRICNPEFGISRLFPIKGEYGGRLWTLDFSKEDLLYLQDQALKWHGQQVKRAGGRYYVYPPWWKYSRVLSNCGCERDG